MSFRAIYNGVFSVVVFLFCGISHALATAYTSAGAGDWSDSGTWSPSGVPANGDTVTIGHAVAVDENTTIGTSPAEGTVVVTVNSGGSLTVNSSITFTVRGDINLNNAPMTLSAGSTLEFDASAASSPSTTQYELRIGTGHNQTSARLNINGTSESRVTIRSNASGGNGWINDGSGPWLQGGLITGTYVDFLRIGDANNNALRFSPTGSSTFSLTNATFTDGGRLGGTYNMGTTCNFTLQNVTMSGTLHSTDSLKFENASGYSSGTRLVDGCVFDKQVHFYTGAGFTVTNNYFADTVDATAGDWVDASGNMFEDQNNRPPGNLDDSYFIDPDATSNPHFLQPLTNSSVSYSGNIFECPLCTNTTEEGDCILDPQPSSAATYTIENNIVLPSDTGVATCSLVSLLGNVNASVAVNHNTWVVSANNGTSPYTRMVTLGETYNTPAGKVTSLKSNIAYSPTSRNAYLISNINGSPVTDVVTSANADYNSAYNMATGSDGVGYNTPITGDPGANDLVSEDPEFVDETCSIATWDDSLGGPGTVANALAELKKKNTSTYDSDYSISALITYVRGCFAPTNNAYEDAGHDGVTIGAVEGVFATPTPTPTPVRNSTLFWGIG